MSSYFRVYIFETQPPTPGKIIPPTVIQTYYIDPFTCSLDEDPYQFIRLLDNGSLVSTGIWVSGSGMDDLRDLCDRFGVKLHQCDFDTANHSGCLSSCIKRGDAKCTH